MSKCGRKIVMILGMLIVQSSLGTKADLVEAKNFGQNGYKKYSDGLMLQWGYVTSSNGMGTIYFSPVFSTTPFALSLVVQHNTTSSDYNSVHANYTSLTASYFGYKKGYTTPTDSEATVRPFYWFAIGRWK